MGFARPASHDVESLETGAVQRVLATATQELRVRKSLESHPAQRIGASFTFYGVKALQHRGKLHRFTEVEQFRHDHTPVVIACAAVVQTFVLHTFPPTLFLHPLPPPEILLILSALLAMLF
jgi:hypothetical protein